jgi:hypothetical protein
MGEGCFTALVYKYVKVKGFKNTLFRKTLVITYMIQYLAHGVMNRAGPGIL